MKPNMLGGTDFIFRAALFLISIIRAKPHFCRDGRKDRQKNPGIIFLGYPDFSICCFRMLSSFHGGGLCRATGNIMPRQGEKARPACNIPDRIRLFNLLDLQLGRQRKRPGLARGNDIPPVLFYPGVFHCTWFPAIKIGMGF